MRSLSLLEEKTQLLRERWWADLLLFAVAFFLMFFGRG